MRRHSRSKNGVASLAYDPRIPFVAAPSSTIGIAGVKPGNDG
jgi:hypothetical protein